MVNTKNANTFTGSQGQEALENISKHLSKVLTLRESQKEGGTNQAIKPNEILFASTGVIGEKYPPQQIKESIQFLVEKLKDNHRETPFARSARADCI